MLNEWASGIVRMCSGRPCFRVYGRASYEPDWHIIDVFATHRRDLTSRWPLWGGHCITWTANVIAVGWDFAAMVLQEQSANPASREHPLVIDAGRLRHGATRPPTASEILAHECGHTGQARRWGGMYWIIGGMFTLFREGPHWWNRFENQASATGQFGGIVNHSVWIERFRP